MLPYCFALMRITSNTLRSFSGVLTSWEESFLKEIPDILERSTKSNVVNCSTTGSPCSPGCRLFKEKGCPGSSLEINQISLSNMVYWLLQRRSEKKYHWKNFYDCFHPPQEKAPAVTPGGDFIAQRKSERRQAILEFPNDIPSVPDNIARSTIKAGKDSPPSSQSHWDDEREAWWKSDDNLKKRMAMSDWYWKWYSRTLKPEGITLTLDLAKAKRRVDGIIAKKMGTEFFDDSTIEVGAEDPIYVSLKKALAAFPDIKICGLDLKIE